MTAAASAARHASLRWAGAPLLALGALLLLSSLVMVARGQPWTLIPHGLLATGLGLAAFGANHDAALFLALRARREKQPLPAAISDELDAELARDRAATLGLHASPGVALAMPAVALLAQGWLAWRLFS
ncbi:hypothetical protein L6R53_20690 [Myxococcota bacterium]|nr:hypothetical protein [Myxococcota bacterium]